MCNHTLHVNPPTDMHNYTKCPHYDLYYQPHVYADNASRTALTACANVRLPIKDFADSDNPFTFVTSDIVTEVYITEECAHCHYNRRGQCQLDSNGSYSCKEKRTDSECQIEYRSHGGCWSCSADVVGLLH
ncbi:wall associated kinase-like protein [Trifolium medium]|uniref:Wall associated kinase-like protein n=1 Tax=Trifolium medium TaxID=97028 RepID=A0A392NVI7_9FABA|nr:wall associated kinase-like protein [Trifolium medium]